MKRTNKQTETIQDIQKEIAELTEFLIFLESENYALNRHYQRLITY